MSVMGVRSWIMENGLNGNDRGLTGVKEFRTFRDVDCHTLLCGIPLG